MKMNVLMFIYITMWFFEYVYEVCTLCYNTVLAAVCGIQGFQLLEANATSLSYSNIFCSINLVCQKHEDKSECHYLA